VFKDSFGKSLIDQFKRLKSASSEPPHDPFPLKVAKNEIEPILESFVDRALSELGISPIVSAQELFFQKNGKVFADDTFYDLRLNYFFDCFLFCPTNQYNPTIVSRIHPCTNLFEFISQLDSGPIEKAESTPYRDYRMMTRPIHSVFKIIKIDTKWLFIKDLFTKNSFHIKCRENQIFVGLSKGSLLQGFLYLCSDGTITSPGCFVHPTLCTTMVNQAIQKTRANLGTKAVLMEKLAFAQIKHFRMKHVSPKIIYREQISGAFATKPKTT
jgi:hypothetical protein